MQYITLISINNYSFIIPKIGLLHLMKQINAKHAQKWLEKVREIDPQTFRQLGKCLKKYERTYDQYQCFVKMNNALISQPRMTQQLNIFMEKGNQMFVDPGEDQRMTQFIMKVKRERPEECMRGILEILDKEKRGKQKKSNEQSNREQLRNQMKQFFKNDPEMQREIDRAFIFTAEDTLNIIKSMQMPHLKVKAPVVMEEQSSVSKNVPKKPPKKEYTFRKEKEHFEDLKEITHHVKPKKPIIFLSPGEQKFFLNQIIKKNSKNSETFSKILFLYKEAIITNREFMDIVTPILDPGKELHQFKDIFQSREDDRRRQSKFRPLGDSGIVNEPRITPSYIFMPRFYPSTCSHKGTEHSQILNTKCITVPIGTQEFNIRPKNIFEGLIINVEDVAYEVDQCLIKLKKTAELLQKFRDNLEKDPQGNYDYILNKAIKIGMIQYLYKQVTKEHQNQIEFYLKNHTIQCVSIFIERLRSRYEELRTIKSIHGQKSWSQIISKNYFKALDITLHEFKRVDKLHTKPFILEELKIRVNALKTRFKFQSIASPFDTENSTNYLKVYNSFQNIIRGQKCHDRNIPQPISYDLTKTSNPLLLPAYVFALEDEEALALSYSFILFYMEYGGNILEGEKNRGKQFLQFFMKQYLGFKKFERRGTSQQFNEQLIFAEIGFRADLETSEDFQKWINVTADHVDYGFYGNAKRIGTLNALFDTEDPFSFMPPQSPGFKVLYSNDNFYVFIRFFYTLYERIIKMKQVVGSKKKRILFELLYYACIKTKESLKYEEAVGNLLKKSSYIFTTFYKLVQNTIRSLITLANCPLTTYSIGVYNQHCCESHYQLILNRYLTEGSYHNQKMTRWNYDQNNKLLYMNMVQIFSKVEEKKDTIKHQQEVFNNGQIYVTDPPHRIAVKEENKKMYNSEIHEMEIQSPNRNYQKVYVQDNTEILRKNDIEYSLDPNTYELCVLPNKEDIMISKDRKEKSSASEIAHELKKIQKLYKFVF